MPEQQKKTNPHKGHRQRMKRQFRRVGIDQFEPHQVLELLLFYAVPQRDTNPLAHRLLDKFDDLPSVLDADYQSLCSVEGVSEHTATFLMLCGQLLTRYHKEKQEKKVFSSMAEIAEHLAKRFVNVKTEQMVLLSLNNRRKEINCSVIKSGTETTVEASVRELVQIALRCGATAVVVAHNHPVGNCKPSDADVKATKTMVNTFQMLNITFLDHLIFAEDGYCSLRESPFLAPLFSSMLARLDEKGGGLPE
ncbi:MAG: RadC family protein [Clostridia bacterium]|nr:RadC family protein [Clostridia bacterium]